METSLILHKSRIKDLLGIGKLIAILLLGVSLIGCKGPEGERGPQGLAGLTGAKGDTGNTGAGTRAVFSGSVTTSPHSVFISAVSTTNFVSLTVYVNAATAGFPTLWEELGNLSPTMAANNEPAYVFQNGIVGIYNSVGNQYRIVVVQ